MSLFEPVFFLVFVYSFVQSFRSKVRAVHFFCRKTAELVRNYISSNFESFINMFSFDNFCSH